MKSIIGLLLLLIIYTHHVNGQVDWSGDISQSKWTQYSQKKIDDILRRQPNNNIAKNVIIFVGDGMGLSTVTAGRILKGQMASRNGEEEVTTMDSMAHLALSKTYGINAQTPDSAATATAILSGVKTRMGAIGVDGRVEDCATQKEKQKNSSSPSTELDSILKWAHWSGKATGIVTTTRVTHATPAATYGHAASRNWEAFDGKKFTQKMYDQGCRDLASQLVDSNAFINVVFGGGRKQFLRKNDSDLFDLRNKGIRVDNRNLINEWQNIKGSQSEKRKFVYKLTDFNSLRANQYDHVMGLFNYDHMNYELDRVEQQISEPSIENMTAKAIELLKGASANKNGFFLLVEGGRIDHAHHSNRANRALREFVAFDNALAAALKQVNLEETLVIATADHSHVFTMGGYSDRGSPITGLQRRGGKLELTSKQSVTHTILLYGDGPGYQSPNRVKNLTLEEVNQPKYRFETAVPKSKESHAGEDVAIYASGPMSHLFTGTVEQSYIAHVMAYSACIGPFNATNSLDCVRRGSSSN